MSHVFTAIIQRQKLLDIDRANDRQYSGGYLRRERPTQRVSHHLPTATVLVNTTNLLDYGHRQMERWEVHHDNGEVLFVGTRREASQWLDTQDNRYTSSLGRWGYSADVMALLKQSPVLE